MPDRHLIAAALLLTIAGCGSADERDGGGRLVDAAGPVASEPEANAAATSAPAAAPAEEPGAGQGSVDARAPAGPGSAQRRAILDALRPAVEARLGPDVEFVVDRISVAPGWALVFANPQRRGGAPIDGRAIFGDDIDTMDGLTVTAILRFQGGRWTLVDHAIGATDVWYCDGRIGAPPSLTGC